MNDDADADGDPFEAVEFLGRSDTRARVLTTLAREQRLSKDELHEQFDASRTTIQRNLTALEDRGWITSTNRDYAITTVGEWLAEDFSALVETVRTSARLGSILELVDTSTFDFDPRDVDFDVTTPEPGNPYAMIQAHTRTLRQADDVRVVLPETGARPLRVTEERVTEHDVSMTFVVSPEVLDTLQSHPEFREHFEAHLAADGFRLFVTDAEIPYYLGLLDDEVQIGVSEDGQPRALLTTESREVFEWAQRAFSEYKAAARPLDEA